MLRQVINTLFKSTPISSSETNETSLAQKPELRIIKDSYEDFHLIHASRRGYGDKFSSGILLGFESRLQDAQLRYDDEIESHSDKSKTLVSQSIQNYDPTLYLDHYLYIDNESDLSGNFKISIVPTTINSEKAFFQTYVFYKESYGFSFGRSGEIIVDRLNNNSKNNVSGLRLVEFSYQMKYGSATYDTLSIFTTEREADYYCNVKNVFKLIVCRTHDNLSSSLNFLESSDVSDSSTAIPQIEGVIKDIHYTTYGASVHCIHQFNFVNFLDSILKDAGDLSCAVTAEENFTITIPKSLYKVIFPGDSIFLQIVRKEDITKLCVRQKIIAQTAVQMVSAEKLKDTLLYQINFKLIDYAAALGGQQITWFATRSSFAEMQKSKDEQYLVIYQKD
jgi:hypothetical protein